MLDLVVRSGCRDLFIGFESLDRGNISLMNKGCNLRFDDYRPAVGLIRGSGIRIWASFVLGCDHDRPESFGKTYEFAMEEKFLFANFNVLLAYPSKPLYTRLSAQGRLLHDKWWLDDAYKFGGAVFTPLNFTPEFLQEESHRCRLRYYSLPSVLRRGLDFSPDEL